MAVQTGLRHLWQEHILSRYVREEITRDEAIAEAGQAWIELAERQRQAVSEDLAWALET